jgi:hypothetical protein
VVTGLRKSYFAGAGCGIITTIANGTAEKAREQEAGSRLSSVRGSKNRLNQSGYVPVLFGRHLATPSLFIRLKTKL